LPTILTGWRAFSGKRRCSPPSTPEYRAIYGFEHPDGLQALVLELLKSDPDWTALPTETPPAIRTLLRRCLTKDRKRRLDSAADAQLEIDDALSPPATDAQTHATPAPRVPSGAKPFPRPP
jgi:hypothetical protein